MKQFKLIIFILFPLLLTSCFDLYQHISIDNKGQANVYTQFTFSKMLIAMAQGFSEDPSSFDYDSWLKDTYSEDTFGLFDGLKYSITKVDNDLDFGIGMSFNLNMNDQVLTNKIKTNKTSFTPYKEGNNIVINIAFSNASNYENADTSSSENSETPTDSTQENAASPSNSSSDGEAMGKVFLSSARYRISINKSYKKIQKVTLHSEEGDVNVNFVDMYDEYLIEIPMIYLLDKDTVLIIE